MMWTPSAETTPGSAVGRLLGMVVSFFQVAGGDEGGADGGQVGLADVPARAQSPGRLREEAAREQAAYLPGRHAVDAGHVAEKVNGGRSDGRCAHGASPAAA